MDEQPQHDRPAEHTTEVPLAPLLTQIADGVEEHIAEAARLASSRTTPTPGTSPAPTASCSTLSASTPRRRAAGRLRGA